VGSRPGSVGKYFGPGSFNLPVVRRLFTVQGLLLLGFILGCFFVRLFGLLPGNVVAFLFDGFAYRHAFGDRVGFIPNMPNVRPGHMSNGVLGK